MLPDSALLDTLVDWLAHGMWRLTWWEVVLYTLATTHITIAAVTIYLHRHSAHRALDLHPVAEAQWHQFPGHGGVTGLCLLSESHLACHTFPEYGSMCLNVFCCRQRPDWNFDEYLRRKIGAQRVQGRRLERPYHER